MAGEWIQLDCNLATKPEVLQISDDTGLDVDVVCGRVVLLWAWCSLNCDAGTARATLRNLCRVAGGDEAFWRAVEAVGWLRIDADAGTIEIPRWDQRFSQAAKSRALHSRRADAHRRTGECAPAHGVVRSSAPGSAPERTREKRESRERKENQPTPTELVPTSVPAEPSPDPAVRIAWSASHGWSGVTAADRQAFAKAYPAADVEVELRRADQWLRANPTKAVRRNWRSFLVRWLTRCQDRGGTSRGSTDPPRPVRDQAAEERRDAERRAEWAKQREESAFEQSRKRRATGAAAAIGLGGNLVKRVADDDDDTETLRARALKALQEARR